MLGMHGSVPWIGTCHHPDTGRQRRRPTDIIPCKASREKFGRSYTLKVSNRVGLDWIYMELYVVLSPINGLITGVITPLTGVITLLITGGGPFLKQTFSVLQTCSTSFNSTHQNTANSVLCFASRTGTTIPHWEILVTHFGVSSAEKFCGGLAKKDSNENKI